MKMRNLIIIFLLISNFATAQEIHKEYKRYAGKKYLSAKGKMSKDGLKNGFWEEYRLTSGKISKKGNYQNDAKIGEWIEYKYFTKHTFKEKGNYLSNKKDGVWKGFKNDTIISSIRTYKNGVLNGNAKTYFDNNQIAFEGQYINGKFDGEIKKYNQSGNLIGFENYTNGIRIGTQKNYFDNGKIFNLQIFDKSGKETYWEKHYENGQVKIQKKDNIWSEFFENGQLKLKGKIIEHYREGKWSAYFDNGNIKQEGTFKEGLMINEWKTFHKNETLKSIENYSNGMSKIKADTNYKEEIISTSSYVNNSNCTEKNTNDINTSIDYLWEMGSDSIRSGLWKEFWKNGKVKITGKFNLNKMEGKWAHYDEKGNLIHENIYKNGIIQKYRVGKGESHP